MTILVHHVALSLLLLFKLCPQSIKACSEEPSPSALNGSTIAFSNPEANKYHVDGKTLPDVDFDVGDSWAGLMPISAAKNETRKLFFWFFPSKDGQFTDDLVFWTQGGPGCSSLGSLITENGPFSWPTGTAKPVPNQWSWTNLSHVLWVEQPVGTGYSQGVPNIKDEIDLAEQFAGFLVEFLKVFSELKYKNFYVTGESYGGYYVPYITSYLYDHPGLVPLNVKGAFISDGIYTTFLVSSHISAFNFAKKWAPMFNLNSTFTAQMANASSACGYSDYSATYVTYPPNGTLPFPQQAIIGGDPNNITSECLVGDAILAAALSSNPGFNVYKITDGWPITWSVLGNGGQRPNQQSPIYFNRSDVQKAIHAPPMLWNFCNDGVFPTDDASPPSIDSGVMSKVIEKSERTVMIHGGLDFILPAEGARIAIQNMTWNGKQGFQTPIVPESFWIDGFGVVGDTHTERMTYVEINLAGHFTSQYTPWAVYKSVWYLLGRGELDSPAIDASLYPNQLLLDGSWAS